MTVSFRVLGPLEIRQGTSTVPLPAVKPRVLMAYLLAHPNRTVAIDDLVGEIWASSPPPSATANVRTYVAGLRRTIRRDSPSLQILAKPGAYQLAVTGGEYRLDVDEFRNLVRQGRTEMAAGSPRGALELLDRALELWRGPAFEGVSDGPVLGAYASHLEEERAQAMEEAFEARLALGRCAEVVPALRRHIRAEPLRERAYAQLMTALYRCGDASGALEVFGSARQALTINLGIEPGPQLAELQRAILQRNPALEPAVVREEEPAGTPFLTPPAIPEFRGRSAEIALGFGVLTAESRSAPPILAVSGMAGVGKTALAVTLAHRVSAHYSDGQLYADLHGDDREPTAPTQVIRHFLDLLEVPAERVPEGLAERAGMLRSRLAGRRVLVLLDNVADESQIRALLPGSADCAVLVTSRRRLSALDGARFLDLECPAEAQAMAVFAGVLGREPAAAERAAAREIVRMCGSLPLAIRIAAARPRRPLARTATLLHDEAQRLSRLRVGDLDVRARFAGGYEALRPADRRLLRLVSLLSAPDVTVPVAAAMTGEGAGPVTASLENLADAHLLIETVPEGGGPPRYRFHELVRIFARERAEAEEPRAARVTAVGNALNEWLGLAEAADQLLPGRALARIGDPPRQGRLDQAADPRAWFARERVALEAAVGQAGEDGSAVPAWRLAAATHTYWVLAGRPDEGIRLHRRALDAARVADDRLGMAVMRRNIAHLLSGSPAGRIQDRLSYAESALRLFEDLGELRGLADAWYLRAEALSARGERERAVICLRASVEAARDGGYPQGEMRGRRALETPHWPALGSNRTTVPSTRADGK